jgi:hypothetical protein
MPSAWITHAQKTFAEMKKKDPKATYSSALKKAATTYKKMAAPTKKMK